MNSFDIIAGLLARIGTKLGAELVGPVSSKGNSLSEHLLLSFHISSPISPIGAKYTCKDDLHGIIFQ